MEQGMITLTDENGEDVELFILEQTELFGQKYILVTDSIEDDGDAEAFILKKCRDEDDETVYETVDDEKTLKALSKLFEELLEDVEFTME